MLVHRPLKRYRAYLEYLEVWWPLAAEALERLPSTFDLIGPQRVVQLGCKYMSGLGASADCGMETFRAKHDSPDWPTDGRRD